MSFEFLEMYDCYAMGSVGGCPSNANLKTDEGFCVCRQSDADWKAAGKEIYWEQITADYWSQTDLTRTIS